MVGRLKGDATLRGLTSRIVLRLASAPALAAMLVTPVTPYRLTPVPLTGLEAGLLPSLGVRVEDSVSGNPRCLCAPQAMVDATYPVPCSFRFLLA